MYPPIPPGVWTPIVGHEKWETPERGKEDRYRRSVYTLVKRTIPYPLYASFDAPTREFCTPRRLPSNTPLQPLMTLNDEVFVECTQALAGRLRNTSGKFEDKLGYGFRLATCREPNENELSELESLFHTMTQDASADSPVEVSSTEQAWNAVATVLLNLDEVLNK